MQKYIRKYSNTFCRQKYLYKELNIMANKGFRNKKSGIKKGERVALCCPNILNLFLHIMVF